jgi:hypothetical protein
MSYADKPQDPKEKRFKIFVWAVLLAAVGAGGTYFYAQQQAEASSH